jgi:transposase
LPTGGDFSEKLIWPQMAISAIFSAMSPEITNETIERQPPEAQAIIRSLLAKIRQLEARIHELESGAVKTPQNSSLPPSTQHPHAKPNPQKPKSKRKRGGQPGHAKHERPLLPTEQCDDVHPLKPEECRRCGAKLEGSDPEPLRHQVWELPEIKPHVTEYQRHRLLCPCCGESTCAELPPGVPVSQAGPRLVAFVALLMAYFRQSKRRTALFLETILGQPCSPAWTVKLQNQATAALRPVYEELGATLPQQPNLGIDESPNKQERQKAWLWTFVAATFTFFTLRLTRAGSVLGELLTEQFCGAVMCDRAKMYWSLGCLQWCWAHLKRDFQALIDSHDPQVKRLGHDLMRPTRKLFSVWVRYRDGTITRAGMKRLMQPIRQEIEGLLLRGAFSGNPRLMGMCNELYDHREWLWTFLDHEGVEPTNNASERALRHAVIWRKLSFGTQSAAGSRFVETMLTVIETCRQQNRNTFTFVADAVQSHFAGRSTASLLSGV